MNTESRVGALITRNRKSTQRHVPVYVCSPGSDPPKDLENTLVLRATRVTVCHLCVCVCAFVRVFHKSWIAVGTPSLAIKAAWDSRGQRR